MDLFTDVPHAFSASAHLTRLQCAQKLGARKHDFPRPLGVLLPRALAGICRAPSSSAGDPKQAGRAIVLRVSRTLRNLPDDLLTRALPHPSAVLHALPIEDRTRGVLDRLLPLLAREATWTVERYLHIPKFGARCLVDLLAAHEEAGGATTPLLGAARPPAGTAAQSGRTVVPFTPVDLGRLDDISRLLRRSLPMVESDAAHLLMCERLASRPITLEHLAAIYRAISQPAPFRVVASGETPVAVAADNHGFSATVSATAARLVSRWGVSTVATVVRQLAALRPSAASRAIVARLLVALPRLRWLDDRMGWFSLAGDRSPLRLAVDKAVSVAGRVPLRALRSALATGRPRAPRPPAAVLARYLSEVADCEIAPTGVRARASKIAGYWRA